MTVTDDTIGNIHATVTVNVMSGADIQTDADRKQAVRRTATNISQPPPTDRTNDMPQPAITRRTSTGNIR